MSINVAHSVYLEAGRWQYLLNFYTNFEVMLLLQNPPRDPLDTWGSEPSHPQDARTYEGEQVITLFRQIMREVKSYLYRFRPPYIYFSVGYDGSRRNLYLRLARMLAVCGYIYAETPGEAYAFYCYRAMDDGKAAV